MPVSPESKSLSKTHKVANRVAIVAEQEKRKVKVNQKAKLEHLNTIYFLQLKISLSLHLTKFIA
jgi:hypothetical protein